jgi:hypothetical protein
MKKRLPTYPPSPQQAARLLDLDVSAIADAIQAKRLPTVVVIDRMVRIEPETFLTWFNRRTIDESTVTGGGQ